MSEIISEYGGMAIATIATICFLALIVALLFSPNGMMAELIFLWGNGGC